MKITKRDLGVLLLLLGVIIAFLSYRMTFSPTMEEVEQLQAEEKSLDDQINAIRDEVGDDKTIYENGMKKYSDDVAEWLKQFPSKILYEDGIMYIVELENNLAVEIPSFTVTESTVSSSVEGTGTFAGKTYSLAAATASFSYTASDYDEVKNFINYVYSDEENKRNINSVTLNFDDKTGEITGSINIGMYAMTDGEKAYNDQELPDDAKGVECIFGEVDEDAEDSDK